MADSIYIVYNKFHYYCNKLFNNSLLRTLRYLPTELPESSSALTINILQLFEIFYFLIIFFTN